MKFSPVSPYTKTEEIRGNAFSSRVSMQESNGTRKVLKGTQDPNMYPSFNQRNQRTRSNQHSRYMSQVTRRGSSPTEQWHSPPVPYKIGSKEALVQATTDLQTQSAPAGQTGEVERAERSWPNQHYVIRSWISIRQNHHYRTVSYPHGCVMRRSTGLTIQPAYTGPPKSRHARASRSGEFSPPEPPITGPISTQGTRKSQVDSTGLQNHRRYRPNQHSRYTRMVIASRSPLTTTYTGPCQ